MMLTQSKGCLGNVPPSTCQCDAKVWIRGLVCGRAYVHSKATVKEALQVMYQQRIVYQRL